MARNKSFILKCMLLICFFTMLLSIPSIGPGVLAAGKEVIRIAGTPAYWVGSRLNDSMFADVIGRHTPYSVKIVGGYSIGMPRYIDLNKGKTDISTDIQGEWGSYQAIEAANPELVKQFKYLALWPTSVTPMPIVTLKSLPVKSLSDIIKKKFPLKIATGRTSSFRMIDEMFKAAGSPGGVMELEKWGGKVEKTSSTMSAPSLMREGIVNAYCAMGPAVHAQFEPVNAVRPLKVIPTIDTDEELNRLRKVMKNVFRHVMKPGWYSFVKEPVTNIQLIRCFIASPKLSDEAAYNITKAVWKERKYLSRASKDLSRAIAPEVVEMSKGGISFHPGAKRFYREQGLWK